MVAIVSIQLKATAQAACYKVKKHMLSLTWNAPIEAFTREGDFFEGKGVDAVYMPFHKLNEFIGLTRLPTFLCNDVIKNPQVEQYLADYQAHFGKSIRIITKI